MCVDALQARRSGDNRVLVHLAISGNASCVFQGIMKQAQRGLAAWVRLSCRSIVLLLHRCNLLAVRQSRYDDNLVAVLKVLAMD